MFCSRCGKTVPKDAAACVFCGMELAEAAFAPASYIATQPRLHMGEVPPMQQSKIVRTTHTTMPDPADDADVLRRTTYRPAYAEPEENAPKAKAKPAEKPVEKPVENATFEKPAQKPSASAPRPAERPTSQPAARPAKASVRASNAADEPISGFARMKELDFVTELPDISADLEEFRRIAEENAEKQSAKAKPAKPVVSAVFKGIGRGAKTLVPKRTVPRHAQEGELENSYEDEPELSPYAEPAEEQLPRPEPEYENEYESEYEEEYEEEGEDEEYDDERIVRTAIEEDVPERPKLFPMRAGGKEKLSTGAKIGRGLIIALVIAAIFFGGFTYLALKTAAKSPISGVTYAMWEKAIPMLESHTTKAYRDEMAALYAADPTGTAVLSRQSADQAALLALMPGTSLVHDDLFMQTVLEVQGNIDMAVSMDALEVMSGQIGTSQASAQRWNNVQAAVRKLKSAKTVEDFEAATRQANVVATPTPAPTPTPLPYTTLTKGMKDSDDVKQLQARLYELGWFTDVRDGDFGPATQSAVKLFQQYCGFTVTGIADPETLAAIYAPDAPRTGTRITPPPQE